MIERKFSEQVRVDSNYGRKYNNWRNAVENKGYYCSQSKHGTRRMIELLPRADM